uniref:Uncharacterized protein n=1 Tax=Cacopsylla melanoneura TaxID=428564 RepID=A0A8D8LNB7_9HEMI
MNQSTTAEDKIPPTRAARPVRSRNSNSRFDDYVIPSNFKFPVKRQTLHEINDSKSNSSSRRKVQSTQDNKTSSVKEINEISFRCQSPDMMETSSRAARSSSCSRDLNNSHLYTNKARKSPDLDFTNNTMTSPGKKCVVNLINEATDLLSSQSTKPCSINISPDLSSVDNYKEYSKLDIFANSTLVDSQSSVMSLGEPKSGKVIVMDGGRSPDLSKHIMPKSGDLFLSGASAADDSPDWFSFTVASQRKSPDLFTQCSQSSFVQSSQQSGVSSISKLIASISESDRLFTSPLKPKSKILPDPRLSLSPDYSMIQNSHEALLKPPRMIQKITDRELNNKLVQVFNMKRLVQDAASPPTKKPKLKDTLFSPVQVSSGKLDLWKERSTSAKLQNGPISRTKLEMTKDALMDKSKKNALTDRMKNYALMDRTNSTLSSISKTMRDVAVDDYYAQTISSQYMSSMNTVNDSNDVFNLPSSWKDDSESMKVPSQSILQSRNISRDKQLNSEYPDLLRDCSTFDSNIASNMEQCVESQDVDMLDVLKLTENNLDLEHIEEDVFNNSLDFDIKDFREKQNGSSLDLNMEDDDEKSDDSSLQYESQESSASSCLRGIRQIVATKMSPSDEQEEVITTQVIKSLKGMIEHIKKSNEAKKIKGRSCEIGDSGDEMKEMRCHLEYEPNKAVEKSCGSQVTMMPGILINDSNEHYNEDIDVYTRDLHFIETSPSHKVHLWLERHLNNGGQTVTPRPELTELNIEDFDSEEMDIKTKVNTDNAVLNSKIEESPEADKENIDSLNIIDTQSTVEPLEKQLMIEDYNTEKVEGTNTQEDLNLKMLKNYENQGAFGNIDETVLDDKVHPSQRKVIEYNSEKLLEDSRKEINTKECINTQTIIEDNTEKFEATQGVIEEINTEKYKDTQRIIEVNTGKSDENLDCPQDNKQFEIECPGSPNAPVADKDDVFEAAQILMSFKGIPSRNESNKPEKIIKFKPGSLGARLRAHLAKQKSATEIWKYEVAKATESQDNTSLVVLYKGRLNLTILNYWSESRHVVVKAIKTDAISGNSSHNGSDTVLLLLKSSDFPKRLKHQYGQNLSIFPPWNSHWVPEIGMSFLTNIERIIFSEDTYINAREHTQYLSLPINSHDEDFYMKLVGFGESLNTKKN